MSTEKYNIIYADPPWSYKAWPSKRWGVTVHHHYDTLSTDAICNLKVPDITAKDAVLFLWATWPNLPQALQVMKAWGFVYKTVAFVWVKLNKNNDKPFVGLGHYTRGNTEVCLIGVKGKLKKVSSSVRQLVFSRRREHSRKPDEVRERIVELFGDLPRIELFAREKVEGWCTWGDAIESDIEL